MKHTLHLTTVLASLAMAHIGHAQMTQPPAQRHTPAETPATPAHHATYPDYRGGGGPVWSEDFGGGFPAGWTVQDVSGICPWRYSLDGSYGYYNGNQNGAASGDTIASTTRQNGFLICDPDSANNVTYGQPSGTTYQYLDSRFTTTAIDLTGHPNVKLEFEQYFRYNNTPTLDVELSTDGSNWTTVADAKGNVQPNSASPNADLVSINISAIAGDQPTVYLRIGWNARVYFWMIDDMRIVDAPANDLSLNSVDYSEWFFDTAPDFGTLEYTVYPGTQLRPFTFKGEFTNEGYNAQTGVVLDAAVTDGGGGAVHSDNGTLATIAPISGDSIYTSTAWTPTGGVDDYTVTFTLSSDSSDANPDDNELVKTYSISDHVFARDRGVDNGRYDNGGEAYSLCNWFNIVNTGDLLYAIDVAVDDDTPAGLLIYAEVRDANRDILATSEEHIVEAGDLNAPGGSTFTHLLFSTPVDLPVGDYLVCVGHYGGAENLWTGISGTSVPQTSLIYDTPTTTWFYLTSTPMVRMNLDPTVGITELNDADSNLGVFPDPANSSATIAYDLKTAATTILDVRDAQGKLVMHLDNGHESVGAHALYIDASSMAEGLYSCTLTVNGTPRTVRLTVLH